MLSLRSASMRFRSCSLLSSLSHFALVGLSLLIFASIGFAQDGAKIYQTILKSTVWILSPRGKLQGGKMQVSTGSGSLLERQKGIILTNYHVVGDTDEAIVLFPDYSDPRKKQIIAERDHYF